MVDLAIDATKAMTELVGAQAWEEISLAWGFQDHLEKLKDKFLDTQAFLEDVGNAKHPENSQLVNHWLEKVKDMAYFADNVMDDYAYEILRRKHELGTCKKKVRNFFTRANNPIVFRFRMTHKVIEILSKFDELDKEAKKIGLRQVKLAQEAVSFTSYNENSDLYQIRKHAAASASEFVGREADENKLVPMLCNLNNTEDHLLTTIAILGIGGVGKTTLARRLYEHEKVDAHFGKNKVWICVSDDFSVQRLLKEMLESPMLRTCELSNIDAIVKKLEQVLKGMKFLLVLDDVWNKNEELWDSLKNELHRIGNPLGSVIMITTRSIEVAMKARVVYQHELRELSEEDGWILLKRKALTSGEILTNVSDFENVGRRIVKKCKGDPLAVKVMGGLLQSKKLPSEWESIATSELWVFPQGDGNTILPSLLLSYNHLPSMHVKQCFAHCAILPKDSLLEKHALIALWLAQGFLYESTMENVGEKYFDVLLNNSLLQEEGEVDEIGEIRWYKMHD